MPQKGQKKAPVRRCVGCGEGKLKKELIRVVRTAQGEISLDTTGRKAGRGAYLCRDSACLQKAEKRKSLERAFSSAIPKEVYLRLQEELSGAQDSGEDGE